MKIYTKSLRKVLRMVRRKDELAAKELTAKIMRLGNRGVRKSIDAAKHAGIANPFVIDGKLVYVK